MNWTIEDVMTTPVICVPEEARFRQVVAALWDHGVSGVPVVDVEGRVVGVVSESDLILHEEFPDATLNERWMAILNEMGSSGSVMLKSLRKAEGATARELMSSPPVVVPPDTTLGEAARLMHRSAIKRVVVVDRRRRPIGMVTRSDLLKVYLGRDDANAPPKRRALTVGGGWPYEPGPDVDEETPLD